MISLILSLSIGLTAPIKDSAASSSSVYILEVATPLEMPAKLPKLVWAKADIVSMLNGNDWRETSPVNNGGIIKWHVESSKPIAYRNLVITDTLSSSIIEPGDSVHIAYDKGDLKFSGKGFEKIILSSELRERMNEIRKPKNEMFLLTDSINDFNEWNYLLKVKSNVVEETFSKYKGKVSPYAYSYLKSNALIPLEYSREMKFYDLFRKRKRFDLSSKDLNAIFDSTIRTSANSWLRSDEASAMDARYMYYYAELEVHRDYNFELNLKNAPDGEFQFFELTFKKGHSLYTGKKLECFLTYLFIKGIRDLYMDPSFERMLVEYYRTFGNSEYLPFVKSYEKREVGLRLVKNGRAPFFNLYDKEGLPYSLDSLNGKPTLLYFWKSDTESCVKTARIIEQAWSKFGKDTGLQILSISVDKDLKLWKKSMKDSAATVRGARQLFVGEDLIDNPILKGYNINTFPSIIMIDIAGRLTCYPFENPVLDNGKILSDQISHQLALLNDGPYIIESDHTITAFSVEKGTPKISTWHKDVKPDSLSHGTDMAYINLPIDLKSGIEVEPCEFPAVDTLLVLSDIEGNFDSFRKLLQSAKVIDHNFNWIFGNGHVVFCGDMFDRGNQVTECLWFLYSLEGKARRSGGYVHFVLGNHEIMNLSGDLRYVTSKYNKTSEILKLPYDKMYNENSELGKWLRSKNVIVKIGDLLFVHGGVSNEVNLLSLSLKEINHVARTFYSRSEEAAKDINSVPAILYNGKTSLFWYRGYYDNRLPDASVEKLIDQTLKAFSVSSIVTGHTVIANSISTLFGNKIINTDTVHANGMSEALLVERNNFYRINQQGEKNLLFYRERR